MRLPEDDERYLNEKGFDWELVKETEQLTWLLIRGYRVSADRYDRSQTDLLIHIPPQYNTAKLDMWYCDPPLCLAGGGYPNAAGTFEPHAGRNWQRFSRHLQDGEWRPGVDGLPLFFTFIAKELR